MPLVECRRITFQFEHTFLICRHLKVKVRTMETEMKTLTRLIHAWETRKRKKHP